MRSEQEMLDLILNIARRDEAIRVVVMNGSRVNPKATRDIFQDFDIIYFVTDMSRFKSNLEWIKQFGELMILQMPETMQDPPPSPDEGFAYLMQFTDGNRIDLNILPMTNLASINSDSLTVLLLDKDGIVNQLPVASDKSYLPLPPTSKAFSDCCNEFWWVSVYAAKALWREEIFYVKDLLDGAMREQLMKMLTWYFGIQTDFQENPGKQGKNFRKHLEPETMRWLEQTYSGLDFEENWEALFAMSDLFRKVGTRIAEKFGFDYPSEEDRRVTAYLKHIRQLPRNASEIY